MITCGRNIDSGPAFARCDKPAVTFYLHEGAVCGCCAEHDYACGSPLTREEAEERQARLDKAYAWSEPIRAFMFEHANRNNLDIWASCYAS